MRKPEEEVHGGLDIHVHRASAHLSEPFQGDEVLHGQGDRHVPGSGESPHPPSLALQATYENPPHVYALADNMYRNMTTGSNGSISHMIG